MDERRGALSTYGLVAGACAALPIPMLDTYLGKLARGAGVRRAARRHGIELSAEAREILASPGAVHAAAGTSVARVARGLITRWNISATTVGSLEDGVAAWLTATLVDHYLQQHPRPEGSVLDAPEARLLRRAVSAAAVQGLAGLGADSPRGVGRALQRVGKAIEHSGDDRRGSQRLADSLLDSLADLPEEALDYFVEAFDRALTKTADEIPERP